MPHAQGVDDLRQGILRTPLDPRVTFLDDPLRVLRAVRFASRFDLRLEESLRAAVELDEVKVLHSGRKTLARRRETMLLCCA